MKKRHRIPLSWIVLTVCGLVLVSASLTARTVRTEWDRWKRRAAQQQRLQALISNVDSRRAEVKQAFDGVAPDPVQLLRENLSTGTVASVSAQSGALSDGYRFRRVVLKVDRVDWPGIRIFLQEVASGSPGWRVDALDFEMDVGGLTGQLVLEALDKPDDAP